MTIFTIFLISVAYSPPACFDDISDNYSYTFTSESNYYCGSAGGLQFTDVSNVTFDCNGYALYSFNGQPFDVSNSQITFIDCILDVIPAGLWVDSGITNLSLKGSTVSSNIDLTTTLGIYNILNRTDVNVFDKLAQPISIFDVNIITLSGEPLSNQFFSNENPIYVQTQKYVGGAFTDYNNFTVQISSTLFGTTNTTTTINLSRDNLPSYTLEDIINPNAISVVKNFTNTSLNFTITFSEPINGTLYILNSTFGIVDSNIIKNYIINPTISANNLKPKTLYYLDHILEDRFGNPYIGAFPPYYTYITLNETHSINDTFEYSGNPENTSSFNLTSIPHDITVEFLQPLNISHQNLSNEIIIENNLVSIDATSRFNKIARLFFRNLPYQSTPIVLRNGAICTSAICNIESYTSNTLIVNVSGFSNYSTVSNSVLNFSSSHKYVGKQMRLQANYSRYNDSTPITNASSCWISLDSSPLINMTYNATSKLYEHNLTYQTYANHTYDINCLSPAFDDQNLTINFSLEYQIIDNFTTALVFKKKTGFPTSKVTTTKNLNLTILSQGTNNTNSYFDTTYSFLVSKDVAYPQTGWNTTQNITSWVNIGKNELVRIYNTGTTYTNYELQNTTIGNFSKFIFIDDNETSLYVNAKACTSGGNCKYYADTNNNVIFEDTTPPQLIGTINISQYYNQNQTLNFTYRIRDLESQVDSVLFSVMPNGTFINPYISTGFIEDNDYTHTSNGYNFIEAEYYKIILEPTNKVPLDYQYHSSAFLIDTKAPVNSTFNISLNDNDYQNESIINLTFNIGQDYNESYTSLNKTASGLDYSQIYISNATLINDLCGSFGSYNPINRTFNITQYNYTINLTSGYCYEFQYRAYDKAGNANIIQFARTVKIDTTPPEIGLVSGIQILDYTLTNPNNAEDIEKSYANLDPSLILFRVKWNMFDTDSTIDYFDISLIDNTTGLIVQNWTNYTSQTFFVNYNESYIEDNHNYKLRVSAVNKAGIRTPTIETNGATIFILKIPELEVQSPLEVMPNYVLDLTDDNLTTLQFRDKNNFNISCKIYDIDVGYQNDSGTPCSFVSQGVVSCNFINTTTGLNNFYVSCKSNESILFDRTYNDENDNLDLEIFVEVNDPPYIVSVNNETTYQTNFNLTENDYLNLTFVLDDIDNTNLIVSNYSWYIGNLRIHFNGTKYRNENTQIEFINDTSLNQSALIITDTLNNTKQYTYRFNNTINHSEIISLNNADTASYLNIYSTSLNDTITSNTYIYPNLNITVNSDFIGGVSATPILYEAKPYTVTINGTNLIWRFSDDNLRNGTHILSVNITDGNDFIIENFAVNITPIFQPPQINYTTYNLINVLPINAEQPVFVPISSFFYENNTQAGLTDYLRYFAYNETSGVEILEIDKFTGQLIILSSQENGSIYIGAKNSQNNKTSVRINFSVTANDDTQASSINVISPINNENITAQTKQIFLNITSNETLQRVSVYNQGIEYIACEGLCNNFEGYIYIGNLIEGNNNLNIEIEDLGFNINRTQVNINFTLDTDLNGTSDILDSDSDNDAVLDSIDSILGTNQSIFTNIQNHNFSINNSNNFSKQYNSTYQIKSQDGNYTYIEFNYDFENYTLDLRGASIIVDESKNKNSVLVSGINLNGKRKTIYIPKSDDIRLNSMCIKDSAITSITQITSTCTAADETRMLCPQASGSYNCSAVMQNNKEFWKLSGLSNSGVQLMCTENWQYSSWSACSSGTQTRSAIDLNNCGTTLDRLALSQSCNVPNPGGTNPGGGSPRGGSSNDDDDDDGDRDGGFDYIPPVNETKEEQEEVRQIKIKPIYLGNLQSDDFEKIIEKNKNYSLVYQSQKIEGYFEITEDQIIFKSHDDSVQLNFTSNQEEIDLDGDGISDTKISFYENQGSYFVMNKIISKVEEGKKDPVEEVEEFEETIEDDKPSSILAILTGIVLTLGALGALGFFVIKNKDKFNKEEPKQEPLLQVVQPQNFDELVSRFLAHSEKLKSIVSSEKDIFNTLKKDARLAVRNGTSWVDIYYALELKGIKKFFRNEIINFEYLVDKFEDFYVKNELETLSEEMRKKLLISQDWFKECYFYDSDGSQILTDILFMLAGVNIYGFKRDKILEMLKDEFKTGIKNFDKTKVDLSQISLNQSHIDKTLQIQTQIAQLRTEVINDSKLINNFQLPDNKQLELEEQAKEIIKNIDKHLD